MTRMENSPPLYSNMYIQLGLLPGVLYYRKVSQEEVKIYSTNLLAIAREICFSCNDHN